MSAAEIKVGKTYLGNNGGRRSVIGRIHCAPRGVDKVIYRAAGAAGDRFKLMARSAFALWATGEAA